MGHYRSEMMCNKCGEIRCLCTVAKKKQKTVWVVTPDFRVVTSADYAKLLKHKITGYYDVMLATTYSDKNDAYRAAKIGVETTIHKAETVVSELIAKRNILLAEILGYN